jgi:16S rRNA processing protein RimM
MPMMSDATQDEPLMAIGRIGAPKGVHGDLKINSYSGEYGHFLKLKEALLEGELPAAAPKPGTVTAVKPGTVTASKPKPGTVTADFAPAVGPAKRRLQLKVLRAQASEGGLVMAFAGYESPEEARKLTGMDILVPRSEAAPLRENEWYIADLIGLVLVAEGKKLAVVESILDGGPEPWLEARLTGGATAVVPFRKEFVGEVRLEKGEIELLAPWILE